MRNLTGALRQIGRAEGWTVTHTRGGHFKVTAPGGAFTYLSHSRNGGKAERNDLARLRRIGWKKGNMSPEGKA